MRMRSCSAPHPMRCMQPRPACAQLGRPAPARLARLCDQPGDLPRLAGNGAPILGSDEVVVASGDAEAGVLQMRRSGRQPRLRAAACSYGPRRGTHAPVRPERRGVTVLGGGPATPPRATQARLPPGERECVKGWRRCARALQ